MFPSMFPMVSLINWSADQVLSCVVSFQMNIAWIFTIDFPSIQGIEKLFVWSIGVIKDIYILTRKCI